MWQGLHVERSVLLLLCGACAVQAAPAPIGDAAAPAPDDAAEAKALLASEGFPARAEVVALTDRLAITASRAGKGAARAELTLLAARLRERLWRLDRTATDGREAAELYSQAVDAAGAHELGCDADLGRALLAGEAARDAAEMFRQLYIAHERQSHLEKSDARRLCLERLKALSDHVGAFRPTGQAWLDLQDRARHESDEHLAATSAAPSAAATVTATAAASAAPAGPAFGTDIIVRPDDSSIPPGPVVLSEIKPYSWPGGGRVVLSLSAPAKYDVGVLAPDATASRGHRIYLDIAAAKPKGVRAEIASKGLISGVRLGKRDIGTRVVIDLDGSAHHRVFYIPDPFRVVVDLSTRQAPPREQPKSGRRTVARVTLDPGHGGWDSGAVGPTGLREKDVALDVAHRAAPALASELGIETMLTRDTDVFVPLEERTARANAFHSDLFVSIHCNATKDGHADGLEIYMLDPTRQMDAAALRAVSRENHNAKEQGRTLDPKLLDAQVASIARGLNVADTTESSRLLAQLLRTSAVASLARYGQIRDHGVKTAAFFVLLGAEMPAALFETSFISNPGDEARLAKADYREKLADAVVNAVRAYRDGLTTR
jgi:N-acetylmuramoyl-L-alanine amidase